jgi:hypothetical protein
MSRSLAFFAGAGSFFALSLAAAHAQSRVQAADLHSVPGQIERAGMFDWQTKRWLDPLLEGQVRAGSMPVYDNTCTWAGGGLYNRTDSCEDFISDGRIPGGVGGNNPLGSSTDNLINSFQFGYCTSVLTGTVDIKVGFYDTLGGFCVGGIAPTPTVPPGGGLASLANPGGYFDFGAASGFPLPGSATNGTLSCWIVDIANVGFCMQSDGDGVFDNVNALDNFNWSFQMENPNVTGVPPGGVIISGDPLASPVGGCTYNIPCGAGGCGHGLDQQDMFWLNVDQNNPTLCLGAAPAGSNCYWFGGYPANPYAGFHMRMGSAGACAGCTPNATNYCTAGTTTNGCAPTMAFVGPDAPSFKGTGVSVVRANNVEGAKQGLVFFGLTPIATPWGTGSTSFLCVKSPTQRAPAQNSGGTSGACNGSISADLNALIAAGSGTLTGSQLFAGVKVYSQAWFRDPAAPKTTNLSDGLELTLCP